MYDYIKLHIQDRGAVLAVLQNPALDFTQRVDKTTGEILPFPQKAKAADQWEVKAFSPTWLEISGSLHKFYTGGYNHNDFSYSQATEAIERLCTLFSIDPALATVVNLEFGVNIKPAINASEVISQIVCCSNKGAIRPYENVPHCCFAEFALGEAYVKVYDKGKQYHRLQVGNILRFEVKARTSRYLAFAGIRTLSDLTKPTAMPLLAKHLSDKFARVVFKDDTIDVGALSKADSKVYLLMKDPGEWIAAKGQRTQTHLNRANRFKQVVAKHGRRGLYAIGRLISDKAEQLCEKETWWKNIPNYSMIIHQVLYPYRALAG